MVHARMIRPAVAGAVPVKVDESSIKDIPGAQGRLGEGLPRRRRRQGVGRHQGRASSSRSSGRTSKPPFPDQTALYDHIRKAPVRKREIAASRPATSTRLSRPPRRWSRPNTNGRSSRTPAWGRPARWSRSRTARSPAGAARRSRTSCRTASPRRSAFRPSKVHVIWAGRPRLLRPQRCRRLRHGCRRAGQGGRQAGAAAIHARAGHRLGPEGPRLDPSRPRRHRCDRQRHRLRVHQQGLLARRRQHHRATSRSTRSPAIPAAFRSTSGDGFGVPAESYEFANKRMGWETIPPLLERASPLRSSHLRDPVGPQIHFASESFMDEVAAAHQRRPGRVPAAARQGAARHRGDQGGGREGGLADPAVAAPRPDRQQRVGTRHRLFAAQRHALCDRRRGRDRPHDRPDLGPQVHRRPRLRPDHQPGRHLKHASRATSCRASAARCGRRSSSTTRR